jgi:hypothetical protein
MEAFDCWGMHMFTLMNNKECGSDVTDGSLGRHASRSSVASSRCSARAFTLMEVMIAGGILFMCLFAILGLVSNSLRNARLLQNTKADPRSSVAALVYTLYSKTNSAEEGPVSGELEGYRFDGERTACGTNGLWFVDLVVTPPPGSQMGEMRMPFMYYNGSKPIVRKAP